MNSDAYGILLPEPDEVGDNRIVRAAQSMIRAPQQQHCIASLAELSGMSRSSFISHFIRAYRKPPGEFLQSVRMHSAAQLLRTTKIRVKCIAGQVGYASRSQFSRAFKLAHGADPSTYRKQYSHASQPAIFERQLNRDVFITDALAARPARSIDSRRQRIAIQELADRMIDNPVDLLPHFVQLAMSLTEAASGGLSIFDPAVDPEVFEWRFLYGLLAPFENATTPRNDSPCGVTLDASRAMLLAHPERIYDWIAAKNLIVPEVLLVPLHVGDEPLGTLWVVAPEDAHFGQGDADILSELASFVGLALKMLRSGGDLQMALVA